jgi:hypothetical protein
MEWMRRLRSGAAVAVGVVLLGATPALGMSGLAGLFVGLRVILGLFVAAGQGLIASLAAGWIRRVGLVAACVEAALFGMTGIAASDWFLVALAVPVVVSVIVVIASYFSPTPSPLKRALHALTLRTSATASVSTRQAAYLLLLASIVSSPHRLAVVAVPVGVVLGEFLGLRDILDLLADVGLRALRWMLLVPAAWGLARLLPPHEADPWRIARAVAVAAVPGMLVPAVLDAGWEAAALRGALGADGDTYANVVSYPAYVWISIAVFIALRAALSRSALLTVPITIASVAIVLVVGAPLRKLHEKKLRGSDGGIRQVVMRQDADREQSLISDAIRRRTGACGSASSSS